MHPCRWAGGRASNYCSTGICRKVNVNSVTAFSFSLDYILRALIMAKT